MTTTLTTLSELYATYKTIELLSTTTKTVTTKVAENAWQPTQWADYGNNTESQLIGIKTGIYDSNNSNYYFFDAVFHEDHNQTVQMTEHPVQTGGNVVDHAFMMPATLSLEIGMSDAMLSLVKAEWSGSLPSKSVNAYRKLLELQQNRLPLTIHTRLKQYENMVIEQITAADDYRTQNGLRATINFKQLLVATVATTTSALSQVTGTTNNGTVNATSA